MDINQTNTLNARMGRDNNDERHVCPLQLDVIERCLQLWTNPKDIVLSPFAGIGSEGVGALRAGRKFVGIELKQSYFDAACKFLESEEREQSVPTLFDEVEA
jgi:DNA modification methylase